MKHSSILAIFTDWDFIGTIFINWNILGLIPVADCCFGPKFIHLLQPFICINLLGLYLLIGTQFSTLY